MILVRRYILLPFWLILGAGLAFLAWCARGQVPPVPPSPPSGTNYFRVAALRGDGFVWCTNEVAMSNGWSGTLSWSNSISAGASNVLLVGRSSGNYNRLIPMGTTNEVDWPLPPPPVDPAVLVCQCSEDLVNWHDLVTVTNDGARPARFLRVGVRKESEGSMP